MKNAWKKGLVHGRNGKETANYEEVFGLLQQFVSTQHRDSFNTGHAVFYTHIVKQQIQSADKCTIVLSYRNSS